MFNEFPTLQITGRPEFHSAHKATLNKLVRDGVITWDKIILERRKACDRLKLKFGLNQIGEKAQERGE